MPEAAELDDDTAAAGEKAVAVGESIDDEIPERKRIRRPIRPQMLTCFFRRKADSTLRSG